MLDQFIGQTLAEKYRIDSILRDDGSGGLGKVYRATHLLMDKPVTVKILAPALAVDENIAKSFSLEARTVSRISHQNILSVTDFGSDKSGTTYIVFEGADGETLKDAVAREGKLPFERAVRITRQIASALSAAHANGMIHRGLTSDNILLSRGTNGAEVVKVLGFGIAAENEDNLADDEISAKKLAYLSPEQNASIAEADERSDIYSLGVIFYEMLAGEVPFTADNPTALLTKQANNPPAPLVSFRADLPPAVEPVILRALAKNPEMRYQTVAEFTNDLNTVSINSGETVVIPNEVLKTNDNVRNNMWKTAFVVLAGISLLAISFIYATSSKQTNPATTLQTDMNGQPVQPLNPATGMNEQGASALAAPYSAEMMANSNVMMTMPPQPAPGSDGYGDGYNPWARGVPPAGAPMYVPPGGQMYTIDPNNPSQFMPVDGQFVPVPMANTNTNANVKPAATPTGKPTPAPSANTAQPQPTPTAETKATPAAKPPTPAPKPTTQPAKTPPAATEKSAQSGKEQDS